MNGELFQTKCNTNRNSIKNVILFMIFSAVFPVFWVKTTGMDEAGQAKKIINWHALYRTLMELKSNGKIERLQSKAGFFWRKK